MELTEEQKQKLRDEGVFIDDFLKVSEKLKELGFSKKLQEDWDKLLNLLS